MLKIMPDIVRLQAFLGTYTHVARYIKDDFLRRVFSFHPLLVGGNPFDTPSVYTLVAQFEKQWGVHYAIGGTGAAVAGLGKLFTDLGGKIYFELRRLRKSSPTAGRSSEFACPTARSTRPTWSFRTATSRPPTAT